MKFLEYFRDMRNQMAAIHRAEAVIEFELDGTVIKANDLFLQTLGYSLSEIQGKHHRMFVQAEEAASAAYSTFWRELARGELKRGTFLRRNKAGADIWILGKYMPVAGLNGKPYKVVKFATDVTARQRLLNSTMAAMLDGSRNLNDISGRLTTLAGRAVEQLSESEQSSAEVQHSVDSAAHSSAQMLVAIQEISRSSAEAASVVRDAVRAGQEANERVSRLGESSRAIGSVVEMIQAIAQQTNLLALNATIEASRAGDAGRGFAVVADEVKQLARRTDEATRGISTQIQAIQADTTVAVSSIAEISKVIAQVDALSSTIAAAVEEQTVATNEITSHVQGAAERTTGIAKSLSVVAQAAKGTSTGAAETHDTAENIAQVANQLGELLGA